MDAWIRLSWSVCSLSLSHKSNSLTPRFGYRPSSLYTRNLSNLSWQDSISVIYFTYMTAPYSSLDRTILKYNNLITSIERNYSLVLVMNPSNCPAALVVFRMYSVNVRFASNVTPKSLHDWTLTRSWKPKTSQSYTVTHKSLSLGTVTYMMPPMPCRYCFR